MNEMIERVARAMWNRTHDGTWPGDADSYQRHTFREDARAAIKAMREPIRPMLDAANDTFPDPPCEMTCGEFGGRLWRAMIDAALRD